MDFSNFKKIYEANVNVVGDEFAKSFYENHKDQQSSDYFFTVWKQVKDKITKDVGSSSLYGQHILGVPKEKCVSKRRLFVGFESHFFAPPANSSLIFKDLCFAYVYTGKSIQQYWLFDTVRVGFVVTKTTNVSIDTSNPVAEVTLLPKEVELLSRLGNKVTKEVKDAITTIFESPTSLRKFFTEYDEVVVFDLFRKFGAPLVDFTFDEENDMPTGHIDIWLTVNFKEEVTEDKYIRNTVLPQIRQAQEALLKEAKDQMYALINKFAREEVALERTISSLLESLSQAKSYLNIEFRCEIYDDFTIPTDVIRDKVFTYSMDNDNLVITFNATPYVHFYNCKYPIDEDLSVSIPIKEGTDILSYIKYNRLNDPFMYQPLFRPGNDEYARFYDGVGAVLGEIVEVFEQYGLVVKGYTSKFIQIQNPGMTLED